VEYVCNLPAIKPKGGAVYSNIHADELYAERWEYSAKLCVYISMINNKMQLIAMHGRVSVNS